MHMDHLQYANILHFSFKKMANKLFQALMYLFSCNLSVFIKLNEITFILESNN